MQSLWLKKAVKILRQREEQLHKRILFLIRLDNAPIMTIMQEWAASSRSLPGIEDFTRGQGEAFYQSALHKLLKALQTEA